MHNDLIAVTLRLCGDLQVAAQPRLPTSSEVGRVVLVDWLVARGIAHLRAVFGRARPASLPTAPQTYLAAPIFVHTTNTSIWPYNALSPKSHVPWVPSSTWAIFSLDSAAQLGCGQGRADLSPNP